jgi:hypothetical protein
MPGPQMRAVIDCLRNRQAARATQPRPSLEDARAAFARAGQLRPLPDDVTVTSADPPGRPGQASYSTSNSNCVEVGAWRKASYSSSNGQCVEVAATPNQAGADVLCLVRDSKDRAGGSLAFTPAAWRAFTAQVKNGDHDPI